MKMKKYLDCYIPTETCNFQCKYCYIGYTGKFSSKVAHFSRTSQEIARALSVKRLGGACLINLCAGGETLLSDEVIPLAKELANEGHYISIVTNGSLTKRIEEIAELPEQIRNHIFLKISFHYSELVRLNILEKFFDNIDLIKGKVSFSVEITPDDELEKHIEDIKSISMKRLGALPHITIPRDDRTDDISILSKHSLSEYGEIWREFDSDLLNAKLGLFGVKRTEFCYAGLWTAYINLETGDLSPCNCGPKLDNIYTNVDKKIKFKPMGCHCTLPHCYNGHSWLTLGAMPNLCLPTYAQERDRNCSDGSSWLQPEMREFMSCKLKDDNREFTYCEKICFEASLYINRGIRKIRKIFHE